jgi:hypothetical protein
LQRSTEPWTARYEDLRQQVLAAGTTANLGGWERALVIRQGLVAWMLAWPCGQVTPPPRPSSFPPTALSTPLPLPEGLRPELTQILVSMILSHRPEIFP